LLVDIGLWRFINSVRAQQTGTPLIQLESNLTIVVGNTVAAISAVPLPGADGLMALGLLGTLTAEELVRAIIQADLRRLAEAPGVGKRTAERLSVELRSRLKERFCSLVAMPESFDDLLDGEASLPEGAGRDDVQITLGALGYEPLEIHRALRAVAAQGLNAAAAGDDWIRECLRWLSRSAA
jgi:Holliday junction DNA helicase RuvA